MHKFPSFSHLRENFLLQLSYQNKVGKILGMRSSPDFGKFLFELISFDFYRKLCNGHSWNSKTAIVINIEPHFIELD